MLFLAGSTYLDCDGNDTRSYVIDDTAPRRSLCTTSGKWVCLQDFDFERGSLELTRGSFWEREIEEKIGTSSHRQDVPFVHTSVNNIQ